MRKYRIPIIKTKSKNKSKPTMVLTNKVLKSQPQCMSQVIIFKINVD